MSNTVRAEQDQSVGQGGLASAARTDPEQWVKAYADDLFRHAVARVRQREVAEDLVQETLLAAWQSRDRFAGRASERTWLMSILKNKIADYYRRQSREVEYADPEALAAFESGEFHSGWLGGAHWARQAVPMKWGNVQESVEEAELWDTLHQCTRKLPEKIAQVFLLREVEEWDSEKICETLKIKRTNLFVMLHRARLALRHCLERNWFGTKRGREKEP